RTRNVYTLQQWVIPDIVRCFPMCDLPQYLTLIHIDCGDAAIGWFRERNSPNVQRDTCVFSRRCSSRCRGVRSGIGPGATVRTDAGTCNSLDPAEISRNLRITG